LVTPESFQPLTMLWREWPSKTRSAPNRMSDLSSSLTSSFVLADQ
jgi:hypothetical protein